MPLLKIIFLFFGQLLGLVDSQCPNTNCPAIVDQGAVEPAGAGFSAGIMCVSTSIVNNLLTTTVVCNGYDPNGLINVFVRRTSGDYTPVFTDSQTHGDGPLVVTFSCGSDGNWTIISPPPAGPIFANDVYCDVFCTAGVTCSATRPATCPASGTAAPPCSSTSSSTTTSTTTTTVAATTPCSCFVGGTWSAWSTPSACNDTCGSCGVTTKTRTCTSSASGCPCSGNSIQYTPCNLSPCNYPRVPCCGTYKSMVNGTGFICGPISATPAATPSTVCASGSASITTTTATFCSSGGTWSSWTNGTCSDTCGMCGTLTRTRTCLSASSGCPCSGSTTTSANCPSNVCYFPRATCCTGFSKTAAPSGGFICA